VPLAEQFEQGRKVGLHVRAPSFQFGVKYASWLKSTLLGCTDAGRADCLGAHDLLSMCVCALYCMCVLVCASEAATFNMWLVRSII